MIVCSSSASIASGEVAMGVGVSVCITTDVGLGVVIVSAV